MAAPAHDVIVIDRPSFPKPNIQPSKGTTSHPRRYITLPRTLSSNPTAAAAYPPPPLATSSAAPRAPLSLSSNYGERLSGNPSISVTSCLFSDGLRLFPSSQADVDVETEVAAAAQPKKRTFRKFSYRGVDLDALLDMSTDDLVQLFPARARRR
jgi:hypothetical protein